MNKHTRVYLYRFNWAIFEALWAMIFIALKLLILWSQLAQFLG